MRQEIQIKDLILLLWNPLPSFVCMQGSHDGYIFLHHHHHLIISIFFPNWNLGRTYMGGRGARVGYSKEVESHAVHTRKGAYMVTYPSLFFWANMHKSKKKNILTFPTNKSIFYQCTVWDNPCMFPCLLPPPCYSALLLGFISGEKGDSRGLPILLYGKAKPQGWNSQILGCKKTFAWRICKGENWINSFREIKEREFFPFISASVRASTQSRKPKIFGLCCSAHAAPHINSRKENDEVEIYFSLLCEN